MDALTYHRGYAIKLSRIEDLNWVRKGRLVRSVVAAFFTALIVCLLPPVVQADIYQYTDASGVLHFTNVTGGKNHKRVSCETRQKIQPKALSLLQEATSSKPSRNAISSSNKPSAYVDIIQTACNRHGVDPALVHAVVKVESDFNPYALSRKGAMGLMQLMPQTALDMNVQNTFSPSDNIDGGVKYLRYLIDRYEGNLSLVLAAYNSGETAVKKWGAIPPFKETQNYVQRVLGLYNGKQKLHVPRYTIYMGYADDGSLLVTDTPLPKRMKTARKDL